MRKEETERIRVKYSKENPSSWIGKIKRRYCSCKKPVLSGILQTVGCISGITRTSCTNMVTPFKMQDDHLGNGVTQLSYSGCREYHYQIQGGMCSCNASSDTYGTVSHC